MQEATKQNDDTQLKGRALITLEEMLKERAAKLLEERKKQYKDFAALQPNHPFTIANKQMLDATAQTSWNATGLLSMSGFLWWALNLTVDLAYPDTVTFNATGGPGADVAVFSSAVTGFFYVDPTTLGGEYNFKLQSVAGGGGEVSIDLFDTNWNQAIASFVGAVVGISASYISGSGNLTYN